MDYDKEFQYKEDLIRHAEDRGISTEGTRAEITARLVAQDEINAGAEADSAKAQEVASYDKPEDAPQEAAQEASAPEGVMTAERVKAKREAAPKDEASGPESEELDGKVLMKMTKRAAKHTVGNYRFSREHPFCLVDKETAEMLTEDMTGFRRASAREAEEYYK